MAAQGFKVRMYLQALFTQTMSIASYNKLAA
uniref:Uncharacterized protein n=1 Tax=Arundo donax TaxID=35708 RepID=A0A0A9A5R0_ARUDO